MENHIRKNRRIIVGISGASGVILGYEMLKALREQDSTEIHLIVTEGAKRSLSLESKMTVDSLFYLADAVYHETEMEAPVASGSFHTDGMIVIPCSMKTLSAIATGYDSNLLVRAAGVCLKENRRIVLVPRETPLSRVHLRNMEAAASDGCIIIPPMLTFYNNAGTLQKQMEHIIGKILPHFGMQSQRFVPWTGKPNIM